MLARSDRSPMGVDSKLMRLPVWCDREMAMPKVMSVCY